MTANVGILNKCAAVLAADSVLAMVEADSFMEEEYIHPASDSVRLLKIGMIYGSNASGKSNVLKALAYFRRLMVYTPSDKNEQMKWVPFLLDDDSRSGHCMMSMTFYLDGKRYILSVEFDGTSIPQPY